METSIVVALVIFVLACIGFLWVLAMRISNDDEYDVSHWELYEYIYQHDPSLSDSLAPKLLPDAYRQLAEELMLDPPMEDGELLSDIRRRLYERAQEIYE